MLKHLNNPINTVNARSQSLHHLNQQWLVSLQKCGITSTGNANEDILNVQKKLKDLQDAIVTYEQMVDMEDDNDTLLLLRTTDFKLAEDKWLLSSPHFGRMPECAEKAAMRLYYYLRHQTSINAIDQAGVNLDMALKREELNLSGSVGRIYGEIQSHRKTSDWRSMEEKVGKLVKEIRPFDIQEMLR